MHPKRAFGGFTLVELMVVLAIVAIVASITVPAMGTLIDRSKRHSSVSELIGLINLARTTAIMEQRTVTLCPLDDSDKCIAEWNSRPVTVFLDDNANRKLDDPSNIIRIGSAPNHGHWTGHTANRPYLRFFSTGISSYAIGNLVWCPANNDRALAAQIVINMGGRPRLSEDQDGDGIVETANGNAVSCN